MNLLDLIRQGKDMKVELAYCINWYQDNELSRDYIIGKGNYSKTTGSITIKKLVVEGDLVIEFNNLCVPISNNGELDILRLDGIISFKYLDDWQV